MALLPDCLTIRSLQRPYRKRSVDGKKIQSRETYGEHVSENLMIEEGAFASRLAGWEKIIRDFDPHLIIADYAPGLSLFARGRWPVLAVGQWIYDASAGNGSLSTHSKTGPPNFMPVNRRSSTG